MPSEPSGSQRSPAVARWRRSHVRSWGNGPRWRTLIRMRPEVQVLPGPLAALTSTNAGRLVRSPLCDACAGSRTLTWLPLLVMSRCPALLSLDDCGSSVGWRDPWLAWLGTAGLSGSVGRTEQLLEDGGASPLRRSGSGVGRRRGAIRYTATGGWVGCDADRRACVSGRVAVRWSQMSDRRSGVQSLASSFAL
jgi:hypothetical protein